MSTQVGEPATIGILRGNPTLEELAALIGVLSLCVGRCPAMDGSGTVPRAAWDRPTGAVVGGWRVRHRPKI